MKKFIWQIKQFFRPFPDIKSWAYALYGWLYDRQLKKTKTCSEVTEGLTFPSSFDGISFRATATIEEEGLENITISTKKSGITVEEASKNLAEFNEALQVILKEMRKYNEVSKSILRDVGVDDNKLSTDSVSVGNVVKENKENEEKKGYPYSWLYGPDSGRIPVQFDDGVKLDGSWDRARGEDISAITLLGGVNRSPTLPSDRVVEYMLPPDEVFAGDGITVNEAMYNVLDEIKKEISYDHWCILDTIIVRTATGHLVGHIDPKYQTFTSSEPFAKEGEP